MARIDHGANDIDVFRDFDEILADSFRSGNRGGIAENIDGNLDAQGFQFLFGVFDKRSYRIHAASLILVIFQRVRTLLKAFGKAHVIELNFLKSEFGSFFGYFEVIFPNFLVVGVDESIPFAVAPDGTVAMYKRILRMLLGKYAVFKNDNAGNRINLMFV
ncbi:hypothetical protein D3C77_546540 [compost metagenome]